MAELNPDPRDLQCVNIISSHKIGAKTTRCLSILFPSGTAAIPATTTNAVCIRAKAPVAGKAITIAEIVKRRIGERQEKWFQYTVLSTETETTQKKVAEVEGGGDEEDPFVPMPEKRKKSTKTAVINIYISRTPLESYRKLYGYVMPLRSRRSPGLTDRSEQTGEGKSAA